MAEVKWIKIVTDIFNNRKIKQIETMPDADSILVIWFKLLCLAGTINENGLLVITKDIPYTEEMLANEFKRPISTVRMALDAFQMFDMIEIVDNILCVSNWEKYQNTESLAKIREQTRKRVAKHREKQKLLTSDECNVTETLRNATEEERRIKNNILCANFFEQIWQMYPNKRGKAQVSASKKQCLHDIGLEEMTRAINRYKKDLERDGWRKPQNGSTFFNSGYVDYLDVNYEDKPTQTAKPVQPSEIPEGWLL